MSQYGPNISGIMRARGPGVSTTWITQLDPRMRVISAVSFACAVVALNSIPALSIALGFAVLLLLTAGLPMGNALKKVLTMDGFIIFMLLMLPFTTPGTTLFSIGSLTATYEGLFSAIIITLKANAIVMTLLSLIGTIDAITLGHALNKLKVPERLVHLMLFSVRYIDVLKQEYFSLRTAMRARCFTPKNNLHTYRSIGFLVGMLLVRSIERSERIMAAMKCRGFQGKFYLLAEFQYSKRDFVFFTACILFCLALLGWEAFYG